jgi:hypothetical protein
VTNATAIAMAHHLLRLTLDPGINLTTSQNAESKHRLRKPHAPAARLGRSQPTIARHPLNVGR